jgi:hypothetical protein
MSDAADPNTDEVGDRGVAPEVVHGQLLMAKLDPKGNELPATADVFGDEIGRPMLNIGTAWRNLVLRANGIKPEHVKKHGTLTRGVAKQ